MTLAEFLAARLDEEAERAWAVHDVEKCDALLYEENMADAARREPNCDCGYPARVLREVEAKRKLIAEAADRCADDVSHYAHVRILAVLAAVYSDHAEYRQEWA